MTTKPKANLTPLRGVVIGLSGLSVIFVIICIGTTHWVKTKDPVKVGLKQITRYSGLFQTCEKMTMKLSRDGAVKTKSKCAQLSTKTKLPGWIQAVQAFMIVGIFLYVAVFVTAFLAVFKEKSMKIVGGFLFASFFICLIGLSIYAGKQKLDGSASGLKMKMVYGWSYIVGWLGTVLALVAGAVAFISSVKESTSK